MIPSQIKVITAEEEQNLREFDEFDDNVTFPITKREMHQIYMDGYEKKGYYGNKTIWKVFHQKNV